MSETEDKLQEQLERLEAGEPLQDILKETPELEADLLALASQISEIPVPEREPARVAGQRQQVMKAAAPGPGIAAWLRSAKWLIPAGAMALLLVVAVLALGAGFLSARQRQTVSESPDRQSVKDSQAPTQTPAQAAEPGDAAPAQAGSRIYIPLMNIPGAFNPLSARLQDIHGIVQVRRDGGTWETITGGYIQEGQRIRTGPLSRARLTFFDGSSVRVGANSELFLQTVKAHQSSLRRIVLFQSHGETEHNVAHSDHPGSAYRVNTPGASGWARDTAFQVSVGPNQTSQFNVLEGSVEVTGGQKSVLVEPGQVTTVIAGHEPEDPVFQITGEGEVEQIGAVWVIAGLSFDLHPDTLIIGNPQVGDLVYVEGRLFSDGSRVADLILLLREDLANHFTLVGTADAIGDTAWTVSGQEIQIGAEAEIAERIAVGDLVRVEGIILEGGVLEATRITPAGQALQFDFTGIVQAIVDLGGGEETWTISGIDVLVNVDTVKPDTVEIGALVRATGSILEDDTWLATEIQLVETEVSSFEFVGTVDSIDPWVVSEIAFQVQPWTFISPGIMLGDLVLVIGEILPDGTWVASEVRLLDEAIDLVFFGYVDSMPPDGPWIVSGITLPVDDNTEIIGDIQIGSLVRVEVIILEDGTWQVVRIELVDGDVEFNCVEFTDVVVQVTDTQLILASGISIALEDAIIDGDPVVGATVLVNMCFSEVLEDLIILVLVIDVPSPEPTPEPEPGEKALVCHRPPGNPDKAKTLSVGASAVKAHLGHGDTEGACP